MAYYSIAHYFLASSLFFLSVDWYSRILLREWKQSEGSVTLVKNTKYKIRCVREKATTSFDEPGATTHTDEG